LRRGLIEVKIVSDLVAQFTRFARRKHLIGNGRWSVGSFPTATPAATATAATALTLGRRASLGWIGRQRTIIGILTECQVGIHFQRVIEHRTRIIGIGCRFIGNDIPKIELHRLRLASFERTIFRRARPTGA